MNVVERVHGWVGKHLDEKRRARYVREGEQTRARIADAIVGGENHFKDEELRYAAVTRCKCGAGMAYPLRIGMGGSWYCSALLTGRREVQEGAKLEGHLFDEKIDGHTVLPFLCWEVKSEAQPSMNGRSTRPAACS